MSGLRPSGSTGPSRSWEASFCRHRSHQPGKLKNICIITKGWQDHEKNTGISWLHSFLIRHGFGFVYIVSWDKFLITGMVCPDKSIEYLRVLVNTRLDLPGHIVWIPVPVTIPNMFMYEYKVMLGTYPWSCQPLIRTRFVPSDIVYLNNFSSSINYLVNKWT